MGFVTTLASKLVSDGICWQTSQIAGYALGRVQELQEVRRDLLVLGPLAIPRPWVSKMGLPAIFPVPNTGNVIAPTSSSPSCSWAAGIWVDVFGVIASLPVVMS